MTQPKCPTCKAPIYELDFTYHNLIIDGVRHRMGPAWRFGCGHLIWDDLCEWVSEDGHSRVVEKRTGKTLLEFREGQRARPDAPDWHPESMGA